MNDTQRQMIRDTLALYGATLDSDNIIVGKSNITGAKIVIKGERIRFESRTSDTLFMSGKISASCVCNFVEKFMLWEKTKL